MGSLGNEVRENLELAKELREPRTLQIRCGFRATPRTFTLELEAYEGEPRTSKSRRVLVLVSKDAAASRDILVAARRKAESRLLLKKDKSNKTLSSRPSSRLASRDAEPRTRRCRSAECKTSTLESRDVIFCDIKRGKALCDDGLTSFLASLSSRFRTSSPEVRGSESRSKSQRKLCVLWKCTVESRSEGRRAIFFSCHVLLISRQSRDMLIFASCAIIKISPSQTNAANHRDVMYSIYSTA